MSVTETVATLPEFLAKAGGDNYTVSIDKVAGKSLCVVTLTHRVTGSVVSGALASLGVSNLAPEQPVSREAIRQAIATTVEQLTRECDVAASYDACAQLGGAQ